MAVTRNTPSERERDANCETTSWRRKRDAEESEQTGKCLRERQNKRRKTESVNGTDRDRDRDKYRDINRA